MDQQFGTNHIGVQLFVGLYDTIIIDLAPD